MLRFRRKLTVPESSSGECSRRLADTLDSALLGAAALLIKVVVWAFGATELARRTTPVSAGIGE
jgi:hypothetical protein